jgi:predicted nucleotidyltransferase
MPTKMNNTARTAAFDFARALASLYQTELGERLIGAYLIGSLAHGGFSDRYSDIDLAIVTEDGLDTAALAALRDLAAERDPSLSKKLSVFWSDRAFTMGRFPPLDRADYIDHAIVLTERERVPPVRPTLDEIRVYLRGAPFTNWTENAHRFAAMEVLTLDARCNPDLAGFCERETTPSGSAAAWRYIKALVRMSVFIPGRAARWPQTVHPNAALSCKAGL